MSVSVLEVTSLHATPVVPLNGSVTLSTVSGDTIYYGQDQTVSSSNNTGSLTAGGSSVTLTVQGWVTSAGVSALRMVSGIPSQDVVLGNDGLVGGPGGTGLTTSVAIKSSTNTFTAQQTIAVDSIAGLVLSNTVGSGVAALRLSPQGSAISIVQQTDWSANTSGQTTYDSIDITHKSAGDAVYVAHHGGVTAGFLVDGGSVAANNGIVWVANQNLSGAAQNAVTVAYVVSGNNTPLSVGVSGSAITVHLATDGGGVATSTGAQVVAAAIASATVQALARAYPLTGHDGSNNPVTSSGAGLVAAMGATSLANAFTGSGGGKSAFNSFVPMFNDDNSSGQGTTLLYKAGAHNLNVLHGNPYSQASAISIDYRAGFAAINLLNQSTGALSGGPNSPSDGSGQAIAINDFSTADTISVIRQTAPVGQSFTGYPTSKGAIISLFSNTGSTTFSVLLAQRSGDSLGFNLRNDGSAFFGGSGTPSGQVQIDKTASGVQTCLTLSNGSASADAGVNLQVLGPSNVQTVLLGTDNSSSANSKLNISVRWASAMFQALQITGVNINYWVPLRNIAAGNEATGAGSAALGANCPAVTATAPYTWEKFTTSDGSACYFPVWK